MALQAFYVFRRTDLGLHQIHFTSGSLRSCKDCLEEATTVERYEDDGNETFAIVAGEREFRILCVALA